VRLHYFHTIEIIRSIMSSLRIHHTQRVAEFDYVITSPRLETPERLAAIQYLRFLHVDSDDVKSANHQGFLYSNESNTRVKFAA